MRKIRSFMSMLMLTMMLCLFGACGTHYSVQGLDEYRKSEYGSSSVEIDQFPGIDVLIEEYMFADGDYYYSYEEDFPFYNLLECAIVYFEYDNDVDYQAAKAYCWEGFTYLGTEVIEEYNGYNFYDFYEKREDDFYHGDNYPWAFKRVAFNDQAKAIVFLGIYSTDERYVEMAEDAKNWDVFLQKYFFEIYSFGM